MKPFVREFGQPESMLTFDLASVLNFHGMSRQQKHPDSGQQGAGYMAITNTRLHSTCFPDEKTNCALKAPRFRQVQKIMETSPEILQVSDGHCHTVSHCKKT